MDAARAWFSEGCGPSHTPIPQHWGEAPIRPHGAGWAQSPQGCEARLGRASGRPCHPREQGVGQGCWKQASWVFIRLKPSLSFLPPRQRAVLPWPMPIGLLLVLLYTLLGNWPVFAYLPPLGHFTTLCNRPCSLWCTSGLDLACQSPLSKESQDFPQHSPGRTPRLWLCRPPWCWTMPARTPFTRPALILLSTLNLLLLFVNSVHISKPEGRETLRRKKTDEGSRNSRTTGRKFRENEV